MIHGTTHLSLRAVDGPTTGHAGGYHETWEKQSPKNVLDLDGRYTGIVCVIGRSSLTDRSFFSKAKAWKRFETPVRTANYDPFK